MTRRTPSARERGSIMIFAVGVLVLMAVLAAVFLTSTQNERQAGLATRNVSEKQQAGASLWMDHVAGIIGRDVFDPINDGTVVAMASPFGSQPRLAPPISGMTAEFERWDYPYTRPGTIGTAFFNTGGDDPWLADIDPRPPVLTDVLGDHTAYGSYASFLDPATTYWHISKVHPQGLFVRIGIDETGTYTNPSDYSFVSPTPAPLQQPDFADGVSLDGSSIFSEPMTSDTTNLNAPTDIDFADADGDGRYDSRWTKLDFADPTGLTIYGAVRVIDLSGLFNVNVHQEFSTDGMAIGPGTTPADVDLLRMLRYTDYASAFGFSLSPLEGVAAYGHLLKGLGYGSSDLPLDVYGGNPGDGADPIPIQLPQNRFASYRDFGAAPNWLTSDGSNVYMFSPFGLDDELELRAFAGLNTGSVRSRLEQAMDYANLSDDGPLRSGILDELMGPAPINELMIDLRHRMTTQSKARRLTPQVGREARQYGVPVGINSTILRTSDPLIDDAYFLPYKPIDNGDREAQLRGAFGGFARALAPYALDRRSAWGTTYDYLHYGWDLLTVSDPESAAQYAIRTAAHMAVNAVDLFNDNDEPPTSVRLTYGRNNDPGSADFGLSLIDATENPANPVLPPGTNRSVHVYGIVPEPYFVEAASFVFYKDEAGVPPADPSDEPDPVNPGDFKPVINPSVNPAERPRKALFVELRNPYDGSATITLGSGLDDRQYELRFGSGTRIPLTFVEGEITLQPFVVGGVADRVIIQIFNDQMPDGDSVRNRLRQELGIDVAPFVDRVRTVDVATDQLVHDFGKIELWRQIDTANDRWMLVDVMSHNEGAVAFPNDEEDDEIRASSNPVQEFVYVESAVLKRNVDATPGDERPIFMIEDRIRNGADSGKFLTGSAGSPEPPGFDAYWNLPPDSDRSVLGQVEFDQFDKTLLVTPFATEPFQLLHVEQSGLTGLTRVGDVGNIPCIGPLLLDPANPDDSNNWVTTSQQLARPILDEDGTTVVRAYQTMYADVLSFRHSVVDGYDPLAGVANEQQLMPALPIATRIFDYFQPDFGRPGQALMTPWAGMININTAPYEVLRMLPTAQPDDVSWTSAPTTSHDFAATMISYRDRRDFPGGHFNTMVQFPLWGGPRDSKNGLDEGDPRDEPGFASIGELLLLFDETGPIDGAVDVFELGGDEASGIGGVNVDILEDDIADDAEERNLLFSNLSNMITVRSDTFCVYLRLRGYRPGDDLGRPTMDERWIAIIDRSNVVRPSDKPRILLMQRVE